MEHNIITISLKNVYSINKSFYYGKLQSKYLLISPIEKINILLQYTY